MTSATLVLGASGATGRLLVRQLLDRGRNVRAIVRSPESLAELARSHEALTVIRASVSKLTDAEMSRHVDGCDAVASCLGHNLSLKGIYGPPHRLVTDAVRNACRAMKALESERPGKLVLMSTAGFVNRKRDERVSGGQSFVLSLLRALLPPHADNEKAAEFLQEEIGSDSAVEWAAVRPDDLIDESAVTPYTIHPSPTRSAIFAAGQTSRINVAHFMAELIVNEETWQSWKGRMPVIYNDADR